MTYFWRYQTPAGLDDLLMSSDGTCLTGLWFEGSRDETKGPEKQEKIKGSCDRIKNRIKKREEREEKRLPVFEQAEAWLDGYFTGESPAALPPIRLENLTPFRGEVLDILQRIPYASVTTYGAIAEEIAGKRGIPRMSAQAAGGAVGWNPVCLMIPCHRVIGSDGSLTGYGGGMRNKKILLQMEKINDRFLFRSILPEEAEEAAEIERICFPPNEACTPERMKERVEAARDLFLVAVEKKTGRMAGFVNGIATDEAILRDEFFTDAGTHNPAGKNYMILAVDVLPQYRQQGLARALVGRTIQREKGRGRERLVLTCLEDKVDMYRGFGFRDLGESASVWGGEKWHEMDIIPG